MTKQHRDYPEPAQIFWDGRGFRPMPPDHTKRIDRMQRECYELRAQLEDEKEYVHRRLRLLVDSKAGDGTKVMAIVALVYCIWDLIATYAL